MVIRNTAAIVLAAGQSKRYGSNKLLRHLPTGKTLIGHTVDVAEAAGCDPIIVVTGAFETEVRQALAGRKVVFVFNENWAKGMGSSIARGAKELMNLSKPPAAFFILVADQPGLHSDLLRKMVTRFEANSPPAIRCNYGESWGPPVLFSISLAKELSQLSGEQGARSVLKKHKEKVLEEPFPEGKHDIDKPDDWEKL